MSLVWNPPPDPPERRLSDVMFKGDVQVAAWKQRRGLSSQVHDDPATSQLSQNALTYVLMEIESRRPGGLRHSDLLHKAMVKFTPQLSQPTAFGDVEPLAHVFAQPEMLEFWSAWESARSTTARGPKPRDAGAKAVLATLGMTGHTHVLDAYADLVEKPQLRDLFARVDAAAAAAAGLPAPAPFELATYRGSLKRLDKLTEKTSFRDLAMATNASLFRGLCELYPDRGFGKRLLIDGCLFPAWTPQIGKSKDENIERSRRRTTPNAGARLVQYRGRAGKHNLDPSERMSAGTFAGTSNFHRGYYYVSIIDQASGWPLVSLVVDAATDEAEALVPLLSDLYRHFPFIEPELIAGDGAWDEVWAHRLCELFYGLAPVFRHTERARANDPAAVRNQAASISGMTNEGQLMCMEHGEAMKFAGFDRPSREGLRPGQGAPGRPDSAAYQRELARREAAFRVRALHDHGAHTARPSVKASENWRRLTAYPKFPDGKPELYTERQALGMRLKNQMEGHFSRMQSGLSHMTNGADRIRLQDWDKVAGLLQLAELRMNALSLAAERAHEGVGHILPPDGEAAPLPEKPYGVEGRIARCRGFSSSASVQRAHDRTARAHKPTPTRHAITSALAVQEVEDEVEVEVEAEVLEESQADQTTPDETQRAGEERAEPVAAAPARTVATEAAPSERGAGQVIAVDFRARRRA